MLIRESSNWPPILGGAHEPGREFPKPEDVILSFVYPENNGLVIFSCRFGDQEFNGHLKAHSLELAEKITDTLSQNLGKVLTDLGDLKVN